MLKIDAFTIEYRKNPLGIDDKKPRFSWVMLSDKSATVQASRRIIVMGPDTVMWDTGDVPCSQSVLVTYEGSALEPKTKYTVSLIVKDNHGETAEADCFFETGLMGRFNPNALWITHGMDSGGSSCPIFIKDFTLNKKVHMGRVYISALGIYEAKINGNKLGDAYFAPGWTSYHHRLQYQIYDITGFLNDTNNLCITTANGWYAGVLMSNYRYGERTAVWAQIELIYENGQTETIVTDNSWQYGTGPARYAEFYHGEVIDHTFDVEVYGAAKPIEPPTGELTAQECEPVRVTKRIKPVSKTLTPKGELVFDFGQNIAGLVEAELDEPRGTKVVVKYAEVLDKDGNFYTKNLRTAKAEDTFICAGGGEVFLPSFTSHGFRYIKVEGIDNDYPADRFTACVLHTDMEPIGEFTCSHPGVNRLQQNIVWGQRGNFIDIPTDCPQRDERLGWTGDAQMFAATAAFNYNTALFFTKWLRDLKADQTIKHGVPTVVPSVLEDKEGVAAWGDAAVIIPMALYRAYGDIRVLEDQYESMKDWVEYISSKAGDSFLWQTGAQYADWLALDKEELSDRVGATDIYLIASAYYAYSTGLTAEAAGLLGYTDDAVKYRKLRDDIIEAFQKEYITSTGRLVSETQTGCVLALHFNLAKQEHRVKITEMLVKNIERHNNHLSTGFVGTPYLCHALSDNGCHELAGKLLLQRDFPSWLYTVDKGATTMWERWNSIKPDGSFEDASMNSFNHYAYGSIGDWIYRMIGGINILEAGYKKSLISPRCIKGISGAKTSLKTPFGELSCEWGYKEGVFNANIRVPVNTEAVIDLPNRGIKESVGSGVYNYTYQTEMDI